MSDQGIKSRPKYKPITIKERGLRHLLITDTEIADQGAFAEGVTEKSFDEHWAIFSKSTVIPDVEYNGVVQQFRAPNHLLTALDARLDKETMGFCLYVIGKEPFLWDVNKIAAKYCMSGEEIAMFASGSGARRVYCNHCQTINEGVTTNVFQCKGCGANLFVRDHFSKRLNAYAGIQVDAEVPGEIPPIEEIYL